MNEYTVLQNGTTSKDITIIGHDLLDAIQHNMTTCKTSNLRGPDGKYQKVIFQETEKFLCYKGNILGGNGGACLILRSETETLEVWIKCTKNDFEEIAKGQEVIKL